MKKITTFFAMLLLCCGIGYTLEEGQDSFTASVPCGKGSIQMTFIMDGKWGCGTGIREYNSTCVDADTEGELVIPDSITRPDGQKVSVNWISRGSFQSCPNLTKVQIPNTVKYISDRSFAGCASLREITFPGNLEIIYPEAFSGCSGLRRVRYLSHNPPMIYHGDKFDDEVYAVATLIVPAEAYERYISNPINHRFRYHAEILPLYKETH